MSPPQWTCLQGTYRAPLVDAAAVWAASQYDSFQLPWNLGGPPPYDAPRLAYVEAWRNRTRDLAAAIRAAHPAAAGVFVACFGHCLSEGPSAWLQVAPDRGGRVPRNVSLADAVAHVLAPRTAGAPWGVHDCEGFGCGCAESSARAGRGGQ